MTEADHKPYAVIRIHNGAEVAAHYQDIISRSRVNMSHLQATVDAARADGYTERAVEQYATREEADAEAARWNARNRVPGISYRAEHFDI